MSSHVAVNRASWDAAGEEWVERGRRLWASQGPVWELWGNQESEIGLLPDVSDLDAVELGCGTGYVSAWLARRGARPVGLDTSASQLATARRLQGEFDLRFPLVQADAERPPFRDESFDLAISEYGASTWCDPHRWIPEAARILRPGGELLFVTGTSLMMLCFPTDDENAPADAALHRDYFSMDRFEWHTEDGTARERRVPARSWRHDPVAALVRVRDRRSHRDAGAGGLSIPCRRGRHA